MEGSLPLGSHKSIAELRRKSTLPTLAAVTPTAMVDRSDFEPPTTNPQVAMTARRSQPAAPPSFGPAAKLTPRKQQLAAGENFLIYVVLGMHKSGTTLVSQTLHQSGISMGPEFDESVTYDAGNQWERRTSWLINLQIVGARESDYFSLDYWKPAVGRPSEKIRHQITALCASAADESEDWGFKDPLSCLTYAQWAEVLPPHRLIAIYRDPGEVMKHYRGRHWDWRRAWRVVRAWNAYNQGILNALARPNTEALCLRYDALMSGDDEINRLQAFVGRDLTDVRKASSYRARAGHPLNPAVGHAQSWLTGSDQRQILLRLDQQRQSQSDT